jgi:hypothetical protein
MPDTMKMNGLAHLEVDEFFGRRRALNVEAE